MIKEEDTIKIGKFQKTHALKGELNALLDIDPEYFTDKYKITITGTKQSSNGFFE